MALIYRIDPARELVTITGDYAEPAEWFVLLSTIAADPAYRRGFSFLRDLRASDHPVSEETVVGIIKVVRAFWEKLGVRRAAIVTRPGIDIPATVAHALAQSEDIPLRAFPSYDDAVSWLRER